MSSTLDQLKEDLKLPKSNDGYLIGVGASAGGLEAIYDLFENPSPPNTSFIIIQHLPPDYKSSTVELLAKHSQREIKEVKNNMLIEPDSVYVMTERKNIVIKDGYIFTLDDGGVQPNYSIDILFKSLAECKGNRSGAIILSGANTDGTKGAEAIKAAGGLVLVQDPSTAQFDTMPSSVIDSGLCDAVIAPKLLMNELTRYVKQNGVMHQFADNSEPHLAEILDLVSTHTPLDFSNYKKTTIIRRIIRRIRHHNFESIKEYINYLKETNSEIDILAKEFMISVTRFFRDSPAFESIKEKVIPELIESKRAEASLKVWVIGCATGEEVYSLAILIKEQLEKTTEQFDVKIFATDIDQKALATASIGIYPESIKEDVSEERLSKYFYKEYGNYRIKENIRSMLIFAQHDITNHPPYYKLDFISCRNVLIYFNPPLQKKILSTLHFCLNVGGYLFLGPSENIGGDLKANMVELDKKWKIHKSIQAGKMLGDAKFTTPKYYLNPVINKTASAKFSKPSTRNTTHDTISDLVLNEFGCAGISVDEHFKIMQTFGDFDKYLLPERFEFNLLEMLPKELSVATGISLKRSIKENIDTEVKDITFEDKGKLRSVNAIIKLVNTNSADKLIFVLFSENQSKETDKQRVEIFHNDIHSIRYVADLEAELKDLKEQVQIKNEELDIFDTNAQAFNEELTAGNEELQSTNEEIQSVNEELQTVNNQYQFKIKELAELNDDLNNYFRSAQNAQIYIDKDLIIRKFTPAAFKQINLKDSDVGRPITDISTNIKFINFIGDIQTAISSHAITEKEVQTTDKKWYQMMLMPYQRSQDNSIDGVVITFNNITELKKLQKTQMKIIEDHNTFIYSVSHDLNSPISNISGIISALNSTMHSDNIEEKELADMLTYSINKLKETVAELADIIKIEKEFSEETLEAIDLTEIINEIEFSIKDILQESQASIRLDLKETSIRFSKKNMRSILLNLLTNAIKYRSPERKLEIHIRTERKSNYIVLSVEDNGIGMNETKKSKLFSKFERVHEAPGIKGTGIGLYLIKRMIDNADGTIKVESEAGKGSTFIVSLYSGELSH